MESIFKYRQHQKKRLQHKKKKTPAQVLPVNFTEFSETAFFVEHLRIAAVELSLFVFFS